MRTRPVPHAVTRSPTLCVVRSRCCCCCVRQSHRYPALSCFYLLTTLNPNWCSSLFPYLVFLGFLTASGKTPRLTLFGFYFLLAFVGATIPAGIYGASKQTGSAGNRRKCVDASEVMTHPTHLLLQPRCTMAQASRTSTGCMGARRACSPSRIC
jgi:hypothetical protein